MLAICIGSVSADEFSNYGDESALYEVVRKIPASNKPENAAGYARLLELNPNKELYWRKFERYSGPDEATLVKIVRGIPASNRSANAMGYARLLALDPNNELYQAKFERYTAESKGSKPFKRASELGTFLAGSWCALDNDPTYVSGPYVKKLIVLANGYYILFSKQAAALDWDKPFQRGTLVFDERRYPETGRKYFLAISKEYGSPKLIVDANDFSVSWEEVTTVLGETARDSCNKFE
jgi:hypothetical protein